eukprot:gnl/MRDRNA2_/MRDRNA2_91909_c0_seq1.p1 gnl/MRDRNA2_/MRDRNA2_91909_c0~~gnl/MRDRNA2_/MRDRNA2_91909_c0_seq1.p1  ORF type:complete len:395 (+),score=91.09 gnl/MRDRNA2_/MRDRNA2_91909_c0_seq1:81-1265(+)
MSAVASAQPADHGRRPMRLKTPEEITSPKVADLLVPSPVRPRFSQNDLDRLSQNVDDADYKHEKAGELARSDSLGDMQLLTIKRDKEFPNKDAILKAEEKRKACPKVMLGLTQEELDKLQWGSDSETATSDGQQSPGDSSENWETEADHKCLYVKRARTFGERPKAITKEGFPQDELDSICKDGVSRIFEAVATRSPSPQEVRVSFDDEDSPEEGDSVYVSKKKERTYLERPHVAPASGQSLGFSQRQLDHIIGYDEADESNVPVPQSSPHGSALNAIKRSKVYKDGSLLAQRQACLESMLEAEDPKPKRGTDQAELDALCVDADDDDNSEDSEMARWRARVSSKDAASKVEDEDSEDMEQEQEWSPWNSPRRSRTSSPRSPNGRSPSPGHGGA